MKYENSVSTFLNKLPELENIIDQDERELPQVALGSFAHHFSKNFENVSKQDFVAESIKLLNEMALSKDERILGLLSTGILEVILDETEVFEKLRQHANVNLQMRMDEVKKFWKGI